MFSLSPHLTVPPPLWQPPVIIHKYHFTDLTYLASPYSKSYTQMYADEDASVLWKVCSEGRIKGFDLKSLQEKVALVPPQSLDTKLASVCCHAYRKANGKSFMAFGLSDNTVAVWDLDRGVIFQTLKMTSTPVCCCFSNDMKSVFLVVQSNATCILQLDLKSGKEVLSIDSGKKRIVSVQVNPKADDVLTVITR